MVIDRPGIAASGWPKDAEPDTAPSAVTFTRLSTLSRRRPMRTRSVRSHFTQPAGTATGRESTTPSAPYDGALPLLRGQPLRSFKRLSPLRSSAAVMLYGVDECTVHTADRKHCDGSANIAARLTLCRGMPELRAQSS